MGKQEIVARILSDAEAEAEKIVADANARAEKILAAAKAQCEEERAETIKEAEARAKRVLDGKAAMARLDSAKIFLAEKRRVIDEIYRLALAQLLGLGRREAVAFAEKLLKENAEEGDEIVFSDNFPYGGEVENLPVVRERGLSVSGERPALGGGFILRGKTSDKDLSYPALLSADREVRQAEIALAVFGDH